MAENKDKINLSKITLSINSYIFITFSSPRRSYIKLAGFPNHFKGDRNNSYSCKSCEYSTANDINV